MADHDRPQPFAEEMDGSDGLQSVATIARRLAEAEDLDATLQDIVDLSVGYLRHCDGATVMLVERGGDVITPASTDLAARHADTAQYRTGQGPCLSAMEQQETVAIEDFDSEERWPDWRAAVTDLGWRSMLGLRLFIAEDTMGALNLYSRRRGGSPRRPGCPGRSSPASLPSR